MYVVSYRTRTAWRTSKELRTLAKARDLAQHLRTGAASRTIIIRVSDSRHIESHEGYLTR